MRDFQHDRQHRESDELETMAPSPAGALADSATSESDAGLDDASLDEIMGRSQDDEEHIARTGFQEIPMSDLSDELGQHPLEAPELADLNAPGEVDIEELDEGDLDGTSLPPDARLDPLED